MRLSFALILAITGGCAAEIAAKIYHALCDGRLAAFLGSF